MLKPDIIKKIFRKYTKKIKKVIFNQDNSRFALVWKTQVEDIVISYYDNMSKEMLEYNEAIIKVSMN